MEQQQQQLQAAGWNGSAQSSYVIEAIDFVCSWFVISLKKPIYQKYF